MSWRYDSTAGATIWDTEPMSKDELAVRDEELAWLIRHEQHGWHLINGRIAGRGAPGPPQPTAMGVGAFGALAAFPLPTSETALTLSATEQGLIPSAHIPIYTPIPINGVLAPMAFRVVMTGVFTSIATSGTLAITPRLGNANTSPSLGASAAQTLTASLTNGHFAIDGNMTIRDIGLPGSNSHATGTFLAWANSAVGGAITTWGWGTGATAIAFDSTIVAGTSGGGLWMGVTFSANFPTMTLQQVHMMDWN